MAIEIFQGHNVRIEVIDGKLWYNLPDVCKVLELSNPTKVALGIKENALTKIQAIDSMGRKQNSNYVSDRGLLRLMNRSYSKNVEEFQDWIDERAEQMLQGKTVNAAGEVPTGEALIALAVVEAQKMLAAKDREIAVLKPKADGYDVFLDARGSVDVQRTAQLLTRAGIETGQKRLFDFLDEIRWTSKPLGRSRRAMQRAVEQKLIELKATGYEHPRTGEWIVKEPQIRITPKGLHKLREMLLPPMDIALLEAA